MFVGTAAWAIPAEYKGKFPDGASILNRYSGRMNAVEVNSSFYRPHRRNTYERWANSVGEGFRFAVKAPRAMSHERRLNDCREAAERFADEVGGLGEKLGAVLVQTPPNLRFDAASAVPFFEMVTALFEAPVVCEPRHASWFTEAVDAELRRLGVGRVAADPFILPAANAPGGSADIVYYRLHGSPEIYASDYAEAALAAYAERLRASRAEGVPVWCIFDNTMHGHATGNALRMTDLLGQAERSAVSMRSRQSTSMARGQPKLRRTNRP
jgi:uncharacterized protein YecE (DUF72 family)